MGQTTSDICYGVLQRVKEHHRFVTEWYKWSNKIRECVNEDFKGSNNIRGLFRRGTKGQTTLDVCYGVVQTVKQHQRFVTECYIVSNNIRCLLRSGTKGQTTQEV